MSIEIILAITGAVVFTVVRIALAATQANLRVGLPLPRRLRGFLLGERRR